MVETKDTVGGHGRLLISSWDDSRAQGHQGQTELHRIDCSDLTERSEIKVRCVCVVVVELLPST